MLFTSTKACILAASLQMTEAQNMGAMMGMVKGLPYKQMIGGVKDACAKGKKLLPGKKMLEKGTNWFKKNKNNKEFTGVVATAGDAAKAGMNGAKNMGKDAATGAKNMGKGAGKAVGNAAKDLAGDAKKVAEEGYEAGLSQAKTEAKKAAKNNVKEAFNKKSTTAAKTSTTNLPKLGPKEMPDAFYPSGTLKVGWEYKPMLVPVCTKKGYNADGTPKTETKPVKSTVTAVAYESMDDIPEPGRDCVNPYNSDGTLRYGYSAGGKLLPGYVKLSNGTVVKKTEPESAPKSRCSSAISEATPQVPESAPIANKDTDAQGEHSSLLLPLLVFIISFVLLGCAAICGLRMYSNSRSKKVEQEDDEDDMDEPEVWV